MADTCNIAKNRNSLSGQLFPSFLDPKALLMRRIIDGNLSQMYVGESNENRKTEIKILNIAPLSYKLADMLPML
jgi:hypothetical protein